MKSWIVRWARHVATDVRREMVTGLGEETKQMLFGRRTRTWFPKIIVWEGVDGINLAQNRDESRVVVKMVM